ncbi:DDE-type integrase/transposase/recombinase [Massilia sp. MB5]|uniref:Mu transposase C-terminal domain-containing protein n=1 Tax=Massilia sp. MB5 TaxID=2919578 RepID=UPI001F1108F0|nr:DDE-type integrase/transposase/recombinase [Massilia sp. MB5]UMR31982.1 DDE-type integrase/transposase/recombinase [Massilia sp. MB5]
MLSDNELKVLMDRLNVFSSGRKMIDRIRKGRPSRNVGSKMNNVACRYPSKKMGVTIQAESHKNELAAIYLWDHDTTTHEFYDQPGQVKLNYVDTTGKRTGHLTTPDFFIIQEDFIGWVECKPEDWLLKREAEGSTMFVRSADMLWTSPPGQQYASEFGLGFKIRSSRENPWIYIRNLTFLSDYWNASPPPNYATVKGDIAELFKEKNCWQLSELTSAVGAVNTDAIFAAVARDDLCVNLDGELLAEPTLTKVYANRDVANAYHLQDTYRPTNAPAELNLHIVNLVPNGSIDWDGKIFTITTLSQENIYLQAKDESVVKLPRAQIERLVKSGDIKGISGTNDPTQSSAIRVVAHAGSRDLAEATARFNAIQQANGTQCVGKRSPRTIRHWKHLQRRGEAIYGDSFIGLIPRTGKRGNTQRKLDAQVIEIMQNVIETQLMAGHAKSKSLCYGIVINKCKDAGLVEPSEKAFRQEIARTRTNFDLTTAREGARSAYKEEPFYLVLDKSTPRHGDRPFEIGHIDHTEIDLQLVGTKFGENLGRAWLTLMLDAYSRTVLAFVLLFDPPSYRSCMLVMRECIRKHGRIPSTLVVDNGKDFKSEYFEQLLARLNTTKKSRPPHKGRFGSVMERFFGISNTQFLHNLRGNNKALQNPRQMSHTHDPRSQAVWTLPAFIPAFSRFVYDIYGNMEHSALGVSPNEALRIGMEKTGYRSMRLIPMTADLDLLCLPFVKGEQAMITGSKGIKIGYIYYSHPLMREPRHHGQLVFARYDPFDISKAYAFIDKQWRPCLSEFAGVFEGRSEREINIASSEIRGKNSRTGERRKINAELIARHLIGVERTEQLLRQQKLDAQSRQFSESDSTGPHTDLPNVFGTNTADLWTKFTGKTYEVLQ